MRLINVSLAAVTMTSGLSPMLVTAAAWSRAAGKARNSSRWLRAMAGA